MHKLNQIPIAKYEEKYEENKCRFKPGVLWPYPK